MQTDAIDFSQQPLVFVHIPKTAGTTLNAVIAGAFPQRSLFHLQRLEPEALREHLADKSLHAYGGHLTYRRLAATFANCERRPLYITVLRDPVERILSAYTYARDSGETRRWHDLASQNDINAFIAIMAKKHRHFLVGKQCRIVGAEEQANADQAFECLQKRYAVVGLQNDMDGFVDRLEERLGLALPRASARNRSTARVTQDELNKKSIRILADTTDQDRKLYDMALAWLGT